MEAALRPHRGGIVLALGILSVVVSLFLIPLGAAAWIMGSMDLKAMDQGRVDSTGRSPAQIGRNLGISAMLLWAVSVAYWASIATRSGYFSRS
jgi:uncharacterized membrane protein YccF (DUF307 family)